MQSNDISEMPTQRIVPNSAEQKTVAVGKNIESNVATKQPVQNPPARNIPTGKSTPVRSMDSDKAKIGTTQRVNHNTEIKGYTILGKIAKGGMGEVYKGIHKGLGKEVILKKLIAKAPQTFYERFKREATIMMEVSHPNVVHLFDYFQENNSSYIVMEYVSGYNLSEIIKKFGQLPVYLATYIAYEIAKGLECAHEKGIIHRDIKPANVLISTRGEIKLTDFGIAFKTNREEETEITKTGTLLGTPAYMSPEQIHNSKDVDERTDLYALGIIFYEMLAGHKPFTNEFSVENLSNIRKGRCKSLRSYNKNVPPHIVRIIKKLTNPKRTKRYNNVKEFIRKIENVLFFKFKDIHEIRERFSVLISNKYSASELDYFKYSKSAVFLEVYSKATLPVLVAILLVIMLRCFAPQILLTFAMSNSYGLANIRVSSERPINFYKLELHSQEKNKVVYRRSDTIKQKKLTLKNVMLPPGKYACNFTNDNKICSTEFIVKSYKTTLGNDVNVVLQNDVKSYFTVMPTLVADKQVKMSDVNIYYKKISDESWTEYGSRTRLLNGESYDFKATCVGYKDAVISSVNVPLGQNVVSLQFSLIKPKCRLVLTQMPIPLDIRLNDNGRCYLDEDGLKTTRVRHLRKIQTIYLNEGKVNIVVSNKKLELVANISEELTNNKQWLLTAEYDEKNNKLFLYIK